MFRRFVTAYVVILNLALIGLVVMLASLYDSYQTEQEFFSHYNPAFETLVQELETANMTTGCFDSDIPAQLTVLFGQEGAYTCYVNGQVESLFIINPIGDNLMAYWSSRSSGLSTIERIGIYSVACYAQLGEGWYLCSATYN